MPVRAGRLFEWPCVSFAVFLCASLSSSCASPSSKNGVSAKTTISPTLDDRTLATHAILTSADLPSDWKLDPATYGMNDPSFHGSGAGDEQAFTDSCLGTDASILRGPPGMHGAIAQFLGPTEESVLNKVMVASSTDEADTVLDALDRDCASVCFPSKAGADPAYTFGKSAMSRRSVAHHGDRMVAYRVTTPVSFKGYQTNVYEDWYFARKGRVFVMLATSAAVDPLGDDISIKSLNTVLDRLP